MSNVSFRFQFQNDGLCLFTPKDGRVPRVVVPLKECPEGKVNGRTTYKCVNTFVHTCMYVSCTLYMCILTYISTCTN